MYRFGGVFSKTQKKTNVNKPNSYFCGAESIELGVEKHRVTDTDTDSSIFR